ncbi:hypothetical protein GO495_10640 [Chitinophaga oryziterrae]|uniref:Transposase (putative) YhgA-like domain-containing protein n=1 Tax=Chitinophaga oryziterrae TaxID=1031224 RepID=A0A6N8J9Y2_9BACT|nr:hypothetical protein [Chitinophaga oryziterrae]MVT41039.1 hypothetical protein [Chitinophaga oryziterrae]
MEVEAIDQKQGNRYDRIVKENMESVLPVIIKDVLELDITSSEEIPDDLQHTKERKPDVLKKVTDRNNRTFVLHLEWQSQNEKDMVYRMAEYALMIQRKYRMPVEQYVIFIGRGGVTMSRTINYKNFKYRYHIIALKDVDYKFFLKSDSPAIKVFSILANFGKDDEEVAVKNIVEEVEMSVGGPLERGLYFNQLRVLAKLHNLNVKLNLNKMIFTDAFIIDNDEHPEIDPYFRIGEVRGEVRGIAIGKVEQQKQIASKMKTLGLELALISKVTDLSVEEVETL